MTNEQFEPPASTSVTTRQVVIGAGVVLLTALAFGVYSTVYEPPDAVRARRAVFNSVIEACRQFDKPDETELDAACDFLLADENPLRDTPE